MTDAQGFEIVWQLATQFFVPTFVVLLGIIAFIYFKSGQPVSAVTFLGFGAVLAAGEGASVYFTHKTISENHWYLDATDPNTGMLLNLMLLGLLIVIVVHLAKVSINRMRQPKE